MITTKKAFTLRRSELAKKFRVENNNLDIAALIASSGFEVVKMRDIARAHRNERDKAATAKTEFRYVQISDIDSQLGRIQSYRTFTGDTAPNNARRVMRHGDVLVSTRRPTRGAVVAVPSEFDGHVCTVFFTSLKVLDWNKSDPRYLALFLRTSLGRFQFQSMITETAYPVISDEDVESLVVLLPRIEVQRELVNQYDEAVESYFAKLNEGYSVLTAARQVAEDLILGDEAERLEVPRVGLVIETADEPEDEETGQESD